MPCITSLEIKMERREERERRGERREKEYHPQIQIQTKDEWFYVGKNQKGKRCVSPIVEPSRGYSYQQPQHTYAEVLKRGARLGEIGIKKKVISSQHRGSPEVTIFVLNLPQKVMAREVWRYFGYKEDIQDIILLRKRDCNDNRYGFIKVSTMRIA